MVDLFSEKSLEFRKDNFKIMKYARNIERYLKSYLLISVPIIVNCATIGLKTGEQYLLNSNLLIDEQGYGKTTILKYILANNNPKIFRMLPEKMYAYELLKLGNEFFNNKILIHEDLLKSFKGLTQKSLEQLSTFWVSVLSEHGWKQLNSELKNVRCNVMFGMAEVGYFANKLRLFGETFFERIVPIFQYKRDLGEKMNILEHKDDIDDKDEKLPKLKLSINPNSPKKIILKDESIKKRTRELALELEINIQLAGTRALSYIRQFMKANALLNERNRVTKSDLELYEMIHDLHTSARHKRITYIVKETIEKNKGLSFEKMARKINISLPTFLKYKNIVKGMLGKSKGQKEL